MRIESPITQDNHGVPLDRRGKVRDWGEMKSYLQRQAPELSEGQLNLLRGYYIGQQFVARGKQRKAQKVFVSLDERESFRIFEDERDDLFAIVDKAVRGRTTRRGGRR